MLPDMAAISGVTAMTQPISFRPLRAREPLAQTSPLPSQTIAPRAATQSASVSIARLTGLARALASEAPPVDHARIAQIRQVIASGGYRPDAAAIADAMLRHYGWAGA